MDGEMLRRKAVYIREALLRLVFAGKSGHTGGALSAVDVLVALYYEVMNMGPDTLRDRDRDRFILSKGHCVEGLYCILADRGFIPKEALAGFNKPGSPLIGHANTGVPGIEANTGALGHGLSIGVGLALGAKMDGSTARTYVMMGDGELAEGSVWEAAMAAAHYRLDNLCAVIDRNGLQIGGTTEKVMRLEDLRDKWAAFGWEVTDVDGHDFGEIVPALRKIIPAKPHAILAHTTKGKGISFMENRVEWHHGHPTPEQLEAALDELRTLKTEARL